MKAEPTEEQVRAFELRGFADMAASTADMLAKEATEIARALRAGQVPGGAGLNGFLVLELSRRLGQLQVMDDRLRELAKEGSDNG